MEEMMAGKRVCVACVSGIRESEVEMESERERVTLFECPAG